MPLGRSIFAHGFLEFLDGGGFIIAKVVGQEFAGLIRRRPDKLDFVGRDGDRAGRGGAALSNGQQQ